MQVQIYGWDTQSDFALATSNQRQTNGNLVLLVGGIVYDTLSDFSLYIGEWGTAHTH